MHRNEYRFSNNISGLKHRDPSYVWKEREAVLIGAIQPPVQLAILYSFCPAPCSRSDFDECLRFRTVSEGASVSP